MSCAVCKTRMGPRYAASLARWSNRAATSAASASGDVPEESSADTRAIVASRGFGDPALDDETGHVGVPGHDLDGEERTERPPERYDAIGRQTDRLKDPFGVLNHRPERRASRGCAVAPVLGKNDINPK